MAVEERYLGDVDAILSHRYDNGGDLWATADKRLLKGAPFSTLECVLYLLELGMEPDEPVLRDAAELIFSVWQRDGRFRIYPTGGIYPCQTCLLYTSISPIIPLHFHQIGMAVGIIQWISHYIPVGPGMIYADIGISRLIHSKAVMSRPVYACLLLCQEDRLS